MRWRLTGSAGVFGEVRYDNLGSAVKKVLRGRCRRRRVETDRFVAMRSHYLFDSIFTTPAVGRAIKEVADSAVPTAIFSAPTRRGPAGVRGASRCDPASVVRLTAVAGRRSDSAGGRPAGPRWKCPPHGPTALQAVPVPWQSPLRVAA